MSSESKKRKADCDTHQRFGRFTNGFALKWKGKCKRGIFFNSSQRMDEKEKFRRLVDEEIIKEDRKWSVFLKIQ